MEDADFIRRRWRGLSVSDPKQEMTMPDRGNEQRLTEIQALVVTLINRLLSASVEHVDGAVQDGLAQLGTFTGRDRAYVFMIQGDRGSNTHEWCSDQNRADDRAVAGFAGRSVRMDAGTDQLWQGIPPARYRRAAAGFGKNTNSCLSRGIRSLLIVPMIDGRGPCRFRRVRQREQTWANFCPARFICFGPSRMSCARF